MTDILLDKGDKQGNNYYYHLILPSDRMIMFDNSLGYHIWLKGNTEAQEGIISTQGSTS